MSINELLQSAYELSLEERKELTKKLLENIKDPMLQTDPYFYERKAQIEKTIEDIESGKMETYDFEESMDELIRELES